MIDTLLLMSFLLLVLSCGVALASIHHRAAHACSTHTSCTHLSIGQGADGGCGGSAPSPLYITHPLCEAPSVWAGVDKIVGHATTSFCAAQKYPEKGKLTERNCADAFVWRGDALGTCCSARLGISCVRVRSDSALMKRDVAGVVKRI